MKPKHVDVELTNGTMATVSVFDIEAMILSLLHDENLMSPENLAPGYDLHTGKATAPSTHYGEIHTGDAWEPARKYFCGDYSQNMPIGLVIFGDKSHFDLHGSLATTPICFTLTCFNQEARNQAKFWRPMGYIPNLEHAKIDDQKSVDKLIDEHRCISACLQPLIKVTKAGGIATKVKGKAVICKVWIHFIIGDTAGLNKWVGHYGSGGQMKCPYRDC